MKICTLLVLILTCQSSLAENLILFATPINSEFSSFISPNEKPCSLKSECEKVNSWREYTVNNLNIMAGAYSGETLKFVMSSHENRFQAESTKPQRWYIVLEKTGLKEQEFKVIDWSIYYMPFPQVNKEQEAIAFSAEEDVE